MLILALTTVLLVTLDLQGNGAVSGIRRVFSTAFRPVQDAVRVVTRPVENAWRGITEYDELKAENQALQDRVDQQEGAFIAALATTRDAQELLALNGIDNLTDISSVTAQVIGEGPTNFSQTVEIGQGSDDGIRVGMPVVNAAGLIGKITEVFPNRSIVMLVTDASYSVPVQIVNLTEEVASTTSTSTSTTSTSTSTTTTSTVAPRSTTSTSVAGSPIDSSTLAPTTTIDLTGLDLSGFVTTAPPTVVTIAPPDTTRSITTTTIDIDDLPAVETGALRGRGVDRAPLVEFIEQSSRFGEVRVGAVVVTAGGSQSLAPRGIVVGRVVKIVERLGTAGAILEVRLSARLDTLNFVRVLLYQPTVSR
ncbi:MAG: rod shape-determining protein MreC [Ilumatobacteraceae bacterium]